MHSAIGPRLPLPARNPGRPQRRPGSRQRGFTLLEILVALVILALSMGILLQLLSRNLQSVGYAEEYSRAVLIARMKMEELLVREAPVPAALEGGEDGGYIWSAQWRAADATAEPGRQMPFELSVTVQWGQPERPKQLRLSTIKLFSIPERQP